MDERLSPAVLRILQAAQRRADLLEKKAADETDIAAGMIADPESYAGRILREQSQDLSSLLRETGADDPRLQGVGNALPLTAGALLILARAKELALSLTNVAEAGTEELLVAMGELWRDGPSFFSRHQIDAESLLRDYFRRNRPAAEPIPIAEPKDRLNLDRVGEQTDVARILDANLNRAREGLRVMEDFARFSLADAGLCARIKAGRHALREVLDYLPRDWLIVARDTENDVGADVTVESEGRRASVIEVVAANCKRAQEAVRSLEEFAKLDDGQAARRLEMLRYELYTIERLLRLRERAGRVLDGIELYWLFDPAKCRDSVEATIRSVADGPVRAIQLRQKGAADRELLHTGRELRRLTRACDMLLFINDRPDLSIAVGADGVHLGQEDLPLRDARRLLGPDAIIGVSTHTLEQAEAAVAEGADYIGVGPVFKSRTKEFTSVSGLAFIEQVHREIRIPAFCIGGIAANNIAQVAAAGGRRFAVGDALFSSNDPGEAARELLRAAFARH